MNKLLTNPQSVPQGHLLTIYSSYSIDTPGVIERVSSLFKGHPKLIGGFNTFLPQGFSIECSPADANTIIVTTPMGTTVRRDSAVLEGKPKLDAELGVNKETAIDSSAAVGAAEQQTRLPPVSSFSQPSTDAAVSASLSTQQQVVVAAPADSNATESVQAGAQVNGNAPASTVSAQEAESKQSTPAEFDQAINYVNKIKQRYAAQPDIYKLFLENLQMYQKGVKPINEVYREISVLFRESPDLLEDFKLFMPENSVVKDFQQAEYMYPQQYYTQSVQLPPVGNFHSGPPLYQNGQGADQSQMVMNQQHYPIAPQTEQQQQQQPDGQQHLEQYQGYPQHQQYQQMQAQYQQQLYPQENQLQSKDKRKKSTGASISQVQTIQKQGQLQPHDEFPVSNLRGSINEKPALISGVLEPVYPKTLDTDLTNEIAFFDKVKKAIGNKNTYNEFLKLLKLYSSDVIDKDTLHDKARSMIGVFPELFEWFTKFIGWEEKPLRIENIAIKKQQIDLMMCKAAGPSYRQLPKSQTKIPCSGRDDLCWSVFNDEWVGHPVWASEESGFIAHRKNQYEEMLFRIEDERHEYDYYMEANLRTIQTLETISNRMANMSAEEKARFKLPVGLGHTSSTIYVKVIRKIYDKDRGWEVIDALHENPAVAVPIILKRLKQKDEEWRRVHREWNKVWREAEQKLMIKSLDHLGLSFKNVDKKLLTNKQLVSEIATIKQEQINKKLHPLMTRPKEELVTKYSDFSIFLDVLKLVNTNLKHNQVYSQNDKDKMENFMRSFLIKFFFMDPKFIEEGLKMRGIAHVEENEADEDSSKEESNNKLNIPTLSQTKKRPRDYDLLKDVLRKNKRKKNEQLQQELHSQASNGDDANGDDEPISEELQKSSSSWISNEIIDSKESKLRDEFNMFVNTQIYVFYRHLDTLYKRLLGIKELAPEADKEIKSRVPTRFAQDLGLLDHHLDDLGISIKGDDSYAEALELCVKLIDNKIEQSAFEESLRNGFRNRAFKLFTVDRVIQSLMKHCHTIVSDSKCSEILLLMEKDRNQKTTTAKDQILYRVQVRSFMNQEENMFKIMYNKFDSTTTITFLAQDDLTIKENVENAENDWKYYLTSYSMAHPTEGLDSDKIRLPFLKSQLEQEQEAEGEIEGVVDSKLSVKIDVDTYRMRFEPESYDLFIRNSLFNKKPTSEKNKSIRVNKLIEVVNGEYGIAGELKGEKLERANEKLAILKTKGPEEYLRFSIDSPLGNTKEDATESKESTEEGKEIPNKDGEVKTQSIDDVKMTEESTNSEEAVDKAVQLPKSEFPNIPSVKDTLPAEMTMMEGDSTIQQDETVEKVDV